MASPSKNLTDPTGLSRTMGQSVPIAITPPQINRGSQLVLSPWVFSQWETMLPLCRTMPPVPIPAISFLAKPTLCRQIILTFPPIYREHPSGIITGISNVALVMGGSAGSTFIRGGQIYPPPDP